MDVARTIKALQETPNLRAEAVMEPVLKSGTVTAATDLFNITAHGVVVGDAIRVLSLTGGTGLAINTTYWVVLQPDANTFKVSATRGGAILDVTVDGSAIGLIKGSVGTISLASAVSGGIDLAVNSSGRVIMT